MGAGGLAVVGAAWSSVIENRATRMLSDKQPVGIKVRSIGRKTSGLCSYAIMPCFDYLFICHFTLLGYTII